MQPDCQSATSDRAHRGARLILTSPLCKKQNRCPISCSLVQGSGLLSWFSNKIHVPLSCEDYYLRPVPFLSARYYGIPQGIFIPYLLALAPLTIWKEPQSKRHCGSYALRSAKSQPRDQFNFVENDVGWKQASQSSTGSGTTKSYPIERGSHGGS